MLEECRQDSKILMRLEENQDLPIELIESDHEEDMDIYNSFC